jgi:hypothetical protein
MILERARRALGASTLNNRPCPVVAASNRTQAAHNWDGYAAHQPPDRQCMLVAVYPSIEVLAELGRVTVAGSRLDLQMSFLWSHLDRDVDETKVRQVAGAVQHDQVCKLAKSRLHGDLQAVVLEVIEIADQARKRRNEVVHQDWVLRGLDAMRPVSDFAHLRGADLEAYRVEWEREPRESDDWQRVPGASRSPAHP